MPQSLSQIYIHLVFSTKDRIRSIPRGAKTDFHCYLGGVLNNLDCTPIEINHEPDHVHLLFLQSRNHSLSSIVRELKKASHQWIERSFPEGWRLQWQAGYGAFSVDREGIEAVTNYIRNQEAHHRRMTFQEELVHFLNEKGMAYDSRFLWE